MSSTTSTYTSPSEEANPEFDSLIQLLRLRAQERPERLAYTFLHDGERDEVHLTYGQLETEARAVAAWLMSRGLQGARVLLLYPPGLDYITAFWGCLYAGAVAVPAYPPRLNRSLERLQAIVEDSQASAALTGAATLTRLQPLVGGIPALNGLIWLATDELERTRANEWREPVVDGSTLAFLQYTSGSTSAPKGVMVTHGNLLHNEEMIKRAFRQSEDSVIVGWLPLYHDMGLIGNVLQPLYVGGRCILMSPLAFLQKPVRWLQAITRYRATTSGGPNFAYDLASRKIGAEDLAALDLSSWSAAFNGAEPVRAETLERFAQTFEPCGFRPSAFYPCYGLAEATLLVSGTLEEREPVTLSVRKSELEKGRALECVADARDAHRLVGCGGALAGQQIIIVDAESQEICADGEVGEIQVTGQSVASGYWNRAEETARTFVERHDETGVKTYLRTGDLGFFYEGELFITGRLKDLIIIRGRNLYPHDIERVMEQSHAALRPGGGVAFSVEVEDEERLVLVQEVERRASADYEEIIGNIREAVADEYEVQTHAVVLVKAGSVPKTSSGKLRRRAARELFLASRFEAVAAWRAENAPRGSGTELSVAPVFDTAAGDVGVEQIALYLRAQLASRLGIDAAEIDARQPLTRFGVDSLLAVELSHELETALGVSLPLVSLLQSSSILEVATEAHRQLECAREPGRLSTAATKAETRSDAVSDAAVHPLSHGQQALWFLHRMAPDSAAYNVASAMRVRGRLEAAILRRVFEMLVERHAALRTTFDASEGAPVQRVHESLPLHFEEVDATTWSDAVWQQWVTEQAHRPFNLNEGPLLRVGLLSRADDEHVLLVVAHHIIVDFWSLAVLLSEMGKLYEAESKGAAANLARLPVQYADYVRRQTEMLEGGEGERLWSYWEKQLGGELPALNLPYDRPRPPVQTYRGATHAFKLSAELTRGLKELAQSTGATLYMVLLSAFQVLLQRYSAQDEFATGSPTASRNSATQAGVVGYFVNPLVIRADLSGNPRFVEHLARVRRTVLEAFAHQDYPFALLVQRLQPERDASRTPLFQAMFVMQQAHLLRDEGLASFALGEAGGQIRLGELVLESIALEQRVALFDLRLSMTEAGETLAASLEYNTDLFDAATIERMASHFEQLLISIDADPQEPLSQLTLLSPTERQRTLFEWNDTRVDYRNARTPLHRLVESQVARTPDAVALIFGAERLTYTELNDRADELAHHLRAHGVGAETAVALCCERSFEMVVALLAILKAGGAYVPLDPAYPAERLAFMLDDSRPRLVLTQHSLRGRLPATAALPVICLDSHEWREQEPRLNSPSTSLPSVSGANLAYIIYTSGSTGRPKGVAIEHGNAAMLLHWARQHFTDAQLSGVLASTSICFDLSVFELFVPLAWGGSVILAANVLELPELAAAGEVTLINTVPSALTELLRMKGVPDSVVTINLAGEPLQNALAQKAYQEANVEQVLNLYGPSEDTTYSTWALIEKGSTQAPTIGRPIANTQVYLLDGELQPVGQGLIGELYIGGAGLARGYLNRPELTAERFIPDAFSHEFGARLYRTGDLARYLSDGRIEFLGRIDNQVKVRGYRIELGEIEALLAGHNSIEEAVVSVWESETGDKQLVAYCVESEANEVSAEELRAYLQARLPKYMVPAHFVRLDALPLTPNGKVDRKALPEPERGRREVEGAGERRARTPVEEVLEGIWSEVLGIAGVGLEDNFFELGGHSLLATQVVSRINRAFQIEMPVRRVFESPTVKALAEHVTAILRSGAAPRAQAIKRVPKDGGLPLSFAQQRLWFLDQLEPESAAYNMPVSLYLRGRLDVSTLEQSLRLIVNRHEALRTVFPSVKGRPVQVVEPPLLWQLSVEDLDDVAETEREAEALRLAVEEAHRPFDLARGPLLRARLWNIHTDLHLLVLTIHHIVSDGWSLGIFVEELSVIYKALVEGRPSPLAELPIQYADYAVWQRQHLAGAALAEQLAYWKRQLGGRLPVLELPSDRPHLPPTNFRVATESWPLDTSLSERVRRFSRERGVTFFMTLLAAFQTLLHRYTGLEDILIGTPIAGRTRLETEKLIGLFANTLVLRGDLSGAPTFDELLERVREMTLEAHAHQDVPFEMLVEELQPDRDLSRPPVFQVMMVLQNAPLPEMALPELEVEQLELEGAAAKFDLILFLKESSGGDLLASWEYNTDHLDSETIRRMARHFQTLLENSVANPAERISHLELMSEAEMHRVVVEWNETAGDFPAAQCLQQFFEQQAARTPQAVALIHQSERLTYSELNARANQLAHHLRTLGVGAETLVGVLMQRSAEMVVALLGVLKAGAAYVPLDPAYPLERLELMLADTQAGVVLTQQDLQARLPPCNAQVIHLDAEWQTIARHSVENPPAMTDESNVAYLIYTSGSTGRPKGVAIEHGNAAMLLHWARQHFTDAQLSGVLASTSICFDLSVFELFVPLAWGGSVILAANVLELPELAAAGEVTLINTVPSALTELLRMRGVPDSVVTINLAGEPLKNSLAQRAYAEPGIEQVLNLYGPSEDTTYSTWALIEKGSTQAPTIGRPIANTQVYLLDGELQPVGQGLIGELYIGGAGLARGYLNRPELTAERFIPNAFSPHPGARLYRTGDLARYLTDGRIEFLGRVDNQVKVRGYRIELGEIEAVLSAHAEIEEAVVSARESETGDKQLVAYYVGGKAEITAEELRAYLQARLPKYMVPAHFVRLDALPLTPNGKVDRKALPEVGAERSASAEGYLASRNAVEELLAGVWAEVLGRPQIGVLDNFFEMGGHSLLATQVISRVREVFEVELPLRSLFETPTVAGLASRVEEARRRQNHSKTEKIEPVSRRGNLPLSFAQERLWFWEQLQPFTPTYNLASAFRLRGELDVAALEQSFNEIVRRHEVLRTSFTYGEGVPGQIIAPHVALKLSVFDLSSLPEAVREREAQRVVGEEGARPFDLAQTPLLRVGLLRLGAQEHVAFLSMHHIISDGWSIGVLVNEVAELYDSFRERRPSTLPDLPVQYADFAAWQRGWLRGEVLETQLAYWKEQLRGAAQLKLPTDRERPSVFNSRGASLPVELPLELLGRLKELSRREGVTLYMTLLAAFQMLLHRYTAQDDIVVGADVANRTRLETEGLIGFFVNMLVLRTDLSGDPSFSELLKRVREVTLGAYAHQDVPFAMLVDELRVERELSRNPLFQVVFVLQNAPLKELELPSVTLTPFEFEVKTSPFDVVFSLSETAGGLSGSLTYSTELFEEETIRRMARHYLNVLEGVVEDASQPLSGLRILQSSEVGDLKPEDFSQVKLSHRELENLFLELGEFEEDD